MSFNTDSFGVLFATLVKYFYDVPASDAITFIGFPISGKIFIYSMALQVSSFLLVLAPGVIVCYVVVLGCIRKTEEFPISSWSFQMILNTQDFILVEGCKVNLFVAEFVHHGFKTQSLK